MQQAVTKPKINIKYDGSLTLYVGGSRRETVFSSQELLWSDLTKRLEQTTRTQETTAEYHALPKGKQGDIKDVGGFVGGVLKEGRRKATAVSSRQLVTLDMDYVGETDPWAAVELLMDCAACMYSTHSHTPASPRLRLLFPLSRSVTADEYAALSRALASDVGIDMFDDTTYDPCRLMYWPSTPRDGEYIFRVQDAPWLDPDRLLRRYSDPRDPTQWPQSSRRTAVIRRLADKQGDPFTKAGLIGAFCRAHPISDAIESFLSNVYAPCAEGGRYTYLAGSTVGGLIVYNNDRFCYSHHGTDPASGQLLNSFDIVRLHRFGAQDDDLPETAPPASRPSVKAMLDFAAKDASTARELAATRVREAGEAFASADMPTDWMSLLDVDKRGVRSTIDNAVIILQNDPNLKDGYAYDEFSDRVVVLSQLPWTHVGTSSWTDADDAGLRHYLERAYGVEGIGKILDAAAVAAAKQTVHPVRDYLLSLPDWDGVRRVDTLTVDYLGAIDDEYTRAVTRKTIVGAVARVMEPGCMMQYVLTLVGPQGCGKSTFARKLGGKWFSDSLTTVQGKEAFELLQGAWIIEMSELSAMRRAELETTKMFISKQTDVYRAAYGRRTIPHLRQCVFIATTNEPDFIHDMTGGRRFWPVATAVTAPTKSIFRELDAERDQIFAEALTLYRAGEPLYLDSQTEAEAHIRQEEHTETNTKQGLIEDYLDIPITLDWYKKSLSERRAWLDNDFDVRDASQCVTRSRVCALEVWEELLCRGAADMKTADAREINGLLRKVKGWSAYDGKLRCGAYGVQKAFIRVAG